MRKVTNNPTQSSVVSKFLSVIVLLSLALSGFETYQAQATASQQVTDILAQPNSQLELPGFKLPYSSDATVYWTGGPHAYDLLDTTAKFPSGEGSGLDFSNGSHFEVLAMATGTVEDASCGNPGFGCQVAIRHFTGNTVMIYAHLKQGSITVKQGDRVSRGDIIGKAGSTGTDNIHLHIELRDGSETCSVRCLPEGLGGNPIGWDDLVELVDGYLIGGYLADSEGLETYNYDGSAVKGDVKVMYDFRYLDQPGDILRKNVIARVHSSFECDSETDCEDNSNPSTQFAGSGFFGGHRGRRLQFLTVIQSSQSGQLVSSNVPNMPSLPPSIDSATFISDVTLPDGAIVSAGESLVKTWRVRNSGTSTWGNGYQLVFVNREQMGAPNAVDVPATAPGQTADVSVNLTAPTGGGDYRGDWKLRNPQGTYFGDLLWVQITVPDDSGPPPSGDDIELTCLDCPAVVPPGETFRPTIRATVNSGQLVESRGDMLRNTDGNLYGAWPHVTAVGTTNQGQTHDFTFYADNPITAPGSEGTYETRWRVWRNGNWAGDEITIRFEVRQSSGTNYSPNPPTLTGPGDWAVYQGSGGITLEAQHNGDPDGDAITHYYFEIFESAQNANSGWITSNSWSPQGLGFHGYQWHAKVRDSQGNESDWSNQVWHFTVLNSDPEIYDFHTETCREAWGGSDKLCFCAQTNAGTLKLQINTANDGSTNGEWHTINELGVPNYDCNTDDDRPPNLDPLPYEDGDHVVRLYARGEGGWGNAAYQDITINLPSGRKPNAPSLRLPLDNSYVNSLAVHFDWEETLRTIGYRLEASTESDFSTSLIDEQLLVGTTEYDYTFSTDYETVYWHITATGPGGTNQSGWRFHIDLDAPTSSVTALPPVTTSAEFTVNWSGSDARSGVRWYHVQVREGNRPESEWADWLINTAQTSAVFQAQPGHTYCFRVRAMDDVGYWDDWPSGDGDTCTLVDLSATPLMALGNVDYAWKHNLVTPNNDSDVMPAHFPIGDDVHTVFPYTKVDIVPSMEAGASIAQPSSGSPDLTVFSLDTYPDSDGRVLVQAVVQNQGGGDTQNGFYTDLYLDHPPTGPGDYTGSVQFWVNDPITAGATIILTTVITDPSGLRGMGLRPTSPITESTSPLYIQVDSTGVVSETDNVNNIYESEICTASPDAYESDETAQEAKPIVVDEPQTHNFDSPGDQDWVTFTAQIEWLYTIQTSNLGPAADTYLYLYDTDGATLLAANDDYGGSLASQIEWTAPVSGTYYILVKHWNPNVGGCSTNYDLQVTEFSPFPVGGITWPFRGESHLFPSQVENTPTPFLPVVLRDYRPAH